MTLTLEKAPLLCYLKLCASFCSQRSIQTGVTVQKHLIPVKIHNFSSRLTQKFERWPWKTIGHLFYTTSSFVHHFIAICEFKLALQSWNAQTGSKLAVFLAATKQLYEWFSSSVRHTFFTMFPSLYHHKIFRSDYQWQRWCPCKRSRSEVKGQGHRSQNPI